MSTDQYKDSRILKSLPIVTFMALFLVTLFLWNETKQTTSLAYRDYFELRVREAIGDIENRMSAYQQVLHGASGLYAASTTVSRSEFRKYVFALRLEDIFPGNQGVGFSIIIPADQKESHISEVRKEGYPEYNIRPEDDRELYTSIVFLEPLADRNLRAFGYDMFSEPTRREAMERARDSAKPAMSGKVRLVQESGKREQAGFLIYVPVYKNEQPHNTLRMRQQNIIGWVYSPFRMNDLMEGIFGERSEDILVDIYDQQINDESLMFRSQNQDLKNQNTSSNISKQLIAQQVISIAGRNWSIRVQALPSLFTRVDVTNPMVVLTIGTLSSCVMGLFVWLLISGRARALIEAKKMNAQLISSENKLKAILDSSAVSVAWANPDGKIEYVNQKFISVFGYTHKDIPTVEHWYARAYPDINYRKNIVTKWNELIDSHRENGAHLPPLEAEIVCSDGTVKNVVLLGSWAGKNILVNFNDITQQKKSEEHAVYISQHDPLTGLANRHLFSDQLEQSLKLAKRNKSNFVVLFIDLDKFKNVNDTLGHKTGDSLLKEVAIRIKECVRESDIPARIGGDEFLVLMHDIKDLNNVQLMAEKIHFMLSQPYFIDEETVRISASIGAAIYPEHGKTTEEIIKNADRAMYIAKADKTNSVVVSSTETS